jgi:hypothetical protein
LIASKVYYIFQGTKRYRIGMTFHLMVMFIYQKEVPIKKICFFSSFIIFLVVISAGWEKKESTKTVGTMGSQATT